MKREGKKRRLLERKRKKATVPPPAMESKLPLKAMGVTSSGHGGVRVAVAGRVVVREYLLHATRVSPQDYCLRSQATPRAVRVRAAVVGDIGATCLDLLHSRVYSWPNS